MFKIVDQFDELPLEICSDEKSQNYNQYYADRGYLNSGVQIDWFCSDTSDAIIQSEEGILSNFQGLRIDLQHCVEYKQIEDCNLSIINDSLKILSKLSEQGMFFTFD